MRTRAGLAALALAVGGLAACGGDGDDGGADRTVSTDEFRSAADDACAQARDRIRALDAPASDPTDPNRTPEEMSESADHIEAVVPIVEELVADLDDMAQPSDSDDAEAADQVTDDLGRALQALRDIATASSAGDGDALGTAATEFEDAAGQFASGALDLGLSGCGEDGL